MRQELKPLLEERMKELLGEGKDFQTYLSSLKTRPKKSIRCNTLKISPSELKKRLSKKGWKIKQPFSKHKEVMIVESELEPGELGRSLEHVLGYYYVQEIASMLPILALNPKPEEKILDLCASPGSKTTQIAAKMENAGVLIANEVSLGRIKILASNLERCGVTNVIITKKEGSALCRTFKRQEMLFDKILIDAPCSGEGTLRTSPKTFKMWNLNTVKKLSRIQKDLLASAFEILKVGGEIIYSTCTHAPEENEEVIDSIMKEFKGKVKIEKPLMPVEINPRQGILRWHEKEYVEDLKLACRIYPHDNDTEGFFIIKLKKLEK